MNRLALEKLQWKRWHLLKFLIVNPALRILKMLHVVPLILAETNFVCKILILKIKKLLIKVNRKKRKWLREILFYSKSIRSIKD